MLSEYLQLWRYSSAKSHRTLIGTIRIETSTANHTAFFLLHPSSFRPVLGIFFLLINEREEPLQAAHRGRIGLLRGTVAKILANHGYEIYEQSKNTRHSTYQKQTQEASYLEGFRIELVDVGAAHVRAQPLVVDSLEIAVL